MLQKFAHSGLFVRSLLMGWNAFVKTHSLARNASLVVRFDLVVPCLKICSKNVFNIFLFFNRCALGDECHLDWSQRSKT